MFESSDTSTYNLPLLRTTLLKKYINNITIKIALHIYTLIRKREQRKYEIRYK